MAATDFTDQFETATRALWRDLAEKALKGRDFDAALASSSADGLAIDPLYTRDMGVDEAVTGIPEAAPFLRGGAASEVATGWDIRERIFTADPETAKHQVIEALMAGATSVTLPVAQPGAAGLSPSVLPDVLPDFNPTMARLAFTPNTIGDDIFAAVRSTFDADTLAKARVDLNHDPIGFAASHGGLERPLDTVFDAAATLFDQASSLEAMRLVAADGRAVHEAGGTPGQELAFVLGSLAEMLRAMDQHGIGVDRVAQRLVVHLCADADFFPSIAKVRAARVLIWQLLDACGAGAAAGSVSIHVQTSRRMMARDDMWTNALRTTLALTGAAVGGAQAVTVLPHSIVRGVPDETARRIARNAQVVLQEESNLGRVRDAAGGSWYVDRLTLELAEHAWSIFQELEAKGGLWASLQGGHLQGMVTEARERDGVAVATGAREITGVSAFPQLVDDEGDFTVAPHPVPAYDLDPALTIEPFRAQRRSEPFEQLRKAARRADAAGKVTILSDGDPVALSAQVSAARAFLAAGGLAGDDPIALAEAGHVRCPAVIVIGRDPDLAALAEQVRSLAPDGEAPVVLMHRAGEHRDALQAAGVSAFMHKGTDRVALLTEIQAALGIDTLGHVPLAGDPS